MHHAFYLNYTKRMTFRNYRFSIKKSPKTKVKALKIPNCGVKCSLNDLYKIYDDILPKDSYDAECTLRDGESLPAGGNPEINMHLLTYL